MSWALEGWGRGLFLLFMIFWGEVQSGEYNWTNRDTDTKIMPHNYWREYIHKRMIWNATENQSSKMFFAFAATAEENLKDWYDEDIKRIYYAKEKIASFHRCLGRYYDFAFQFFWVAYCWVCGLYLLWKRHFTLRIWDPPHYHNPTHGTKSFNYLMSTFAAEEVKTIIQTDSEDEPELDILNCASECVTESSEDERQRRYQNPEEYGKLVSRKVRHLSELEDPKYGNDINIKRKKKAWSPNANNMLYGFRIRNFKPPLYASKKFDINGTPKYPKIYEIRRDMLAPNPILVRL